MPLLQDQVMVRFVSEAYQMAPEVGEEIPVMDGLILNASEVTSSSVPVIPVMLVILIFPASEIFLFAPITPDAQS